MHVRVRVGERSRRTPRFLGTQGPLNLDKEESDQEASKSTGLVEKITCPILFALTAGSH